MDLPNKSKYTVCEVARVLADRRGCTIHAARQQIYYRINTDKIRVERSMDMISIPRDQAVKIVSNQEE